MTGSSSELVFGLLPHYDPTQGLPGASIAKKKSGRDPM